jgi:hypothetical protein
MPSQSRNFAGASYVDPPTTAIDGVVGNDEPIGQAAGPQSSWVSLSRSPWMETARREPSSLQAQCLYPPGCNRSPGCVHIHVLDFHVLLLIAPE